MARALGVQSREIWEVIAALLSDQLSQLGPRKPPKRHFFQGFSWFIDGTVFDGNDGTVFDGKNVVKIEPWSRPVPLTISSAVNSYRPVPSRKYLPLHFTVPSRRGNIPPTVPSRRQNLPLPSRPVVKTCPYRPVPPSKPVLTILPRHSMPSLVPVKINVQYSY